MFEAVTHSQALLEVDSVSGLCICDLDGCGPHGLMLAVEKGCNRIFALTPDGAVACDADAVGEPATRSVSIAAADLDGDGAEEIFLANSETRQGVKQAPDFAFDLFEGGFRDLLEPLRDRNGAGGFAEPRVCAFPHLDGRYGFFLVPRGGPARLYREAAGAIIDTAADRGLDVISAPDALALAPLVSERLDLVVSGSAETLLLSADGTGTFRPVPCSDHLPPALCLRALADPNGRRFDLLLASAGGTASLLRLDDSGEPQDVAPPLLAHPGRILSMVLADFDNDGADELFFSLAGEPNRIFGWREGGWRPLELGAATLPLEAHGIAVAADIDRDGCLELLLYPGRSGNGRPRLFRAAEAARNRWIRVLARGPTGASARGARIPPEEEGRLRQRILDCGNGTVQGEPVAHFGLGTACRPDRVEVRWPDSAVVQLAAPRPGRLLEIRHPRGAP